MVTVFVPTMLRRLSHGARTAEVAPGTLAAIIRQLDQRFPGMEDALLEAGRMRAGVAASINGESTSSLFDEVPGGSEVHFVLAVSGG